MICDLLSVAYFALSTVVVELCFILFFLFFFIINLTPCRIPEAGYEPGTSCLSYIVCIFTQEDPLGNELASPTASLPSSCPHHL